jgi:exopolyphosphatase/guanosine-5'-triphosphate,3'-diphosphate pyrophosphatase
VDAGATQRLIAVIDIGSNSGRLTVLRLDRGGHMVVVGDARVPLRLVRDLAAPGQRPRLGDRTFSHTVEAVRGFRAIANSAGALSCVAVATAAVREAANGYELADRIREQAGVEVEIIDGPREAALAFRGAIHGLPVEHGLVLDIGGGSLQLAQFRDRRLVRSWSLPLGALRLSDRFLKIDPPSPTQLTRLRKHIRRTLNDAAIPQLEPEEVLIGTGGTIRNLARIDRRTRAYPIARLHGYALQYAAARRVAGLVVQTTTASRTSIPGLNRDRTDSIAGGAVAAEEVMRAVAAQEIQVSGHGLREGVALDAWLPQLPAPSAMREASIAGLGARYATWRPDVAARRARTALRLQKAVEPDATVEARETLGLAASIVDIGLSVEYYNRFQHAAHVLVAADLAGFSHRRLALLAATIHLADKEDGGLRGFEPLLTAADQPILSRGAAILVVADALEQFVGGTSLLRCTRQAGVLTLTVNVAEPWLLREPLRRLGQAYRLDVRFAQHARAA